jgi:transposase-like protein
MEQATSTNILSRVLRAGDTPPAASICAACGTLGLKAGSRNTRLGRIQKFYCRQCRRHFSAAPLPRRQYPPSAILTALTSYHLGRTLADTRADVARRSRVNVPLSTLHAWIGQFAQVCTFTNLRKRYTLEPEEVLYSKTFVHKQEYKFAFHRLKTNVLCKRRFPSIRRYLWNISENCPNDLFQRSDGARCSDGNLPNLQLRLVRKETNAQALAKLGLLLARRSKERHPAIQHFMLVNDSATIAVEVPVYLHPYEAPDLQLGGALTGHIDVLQVRGRKVWILDYKPDARLEKRAKYQLYLYARALSARTGLPLSRFGLAYFDNKDYFEVIIDPPMAVRTQTA